MNEEEMRKLIKLWGDCTANLFEQLNLGKWKDSEGHDVRLNRAMMEMAVPFKIAIDFEMGKPHA